MRFFIATFLTATASARLFRLCEDDECRYGQIEDSTQCALCSSKSCDDKDSSTEDYCYQEEGCYHWDGTNFWGPVVECFDTSTSVANADKGCSESLPICTLRDGSDPGEGNPGVQCSVCSQALCDDGDPTTEDICYPTWGCENYPPEPPETCGAVSAEDPEEPADPAEPWKCNDPLPSCTRYSWCSCITDVEGNPFCASDEYCAYSNSCTSSDDCGYNRKCVFGCCAYALRPTGSCVWDCAYPDAFRGFHYEEGPTILGSW